jgi:ABC-2 type transport system permease protein/oleandomycin transport system permease protein
MPGWLQPWANHQPVSIAVNSARALFSGQPAWHFVWQLLAWAVAILVVFVPLSVWQYRRM